MFVTPSVGANVTGEPLQKALAPTIPIEKVGGLVLMVILEEAVPVQPSV